MAMSTPVVLEAKEILQQSLLSVDLPIASTRELSLICRIFRLPKALSQDANEEQVRMPGAYIFPPIREPSLKEIVPLAIPVHIDRQPVVQRILGFLSKGQERHIGIDIIPHDTLKRIFLFAHVNESLLHGPLTLINVSKQWRAIAFTVPTLWDNLDITCSNSTNPFYTMIYHICHAQNLRLFVNSSAVLAALTTLSTVVPPSVRPKVRLVQLKSIVLLGFGAIESIDSFSFHYPSLTELTLIDVHRLFPINLLANCPALEILTIVFSVEVIHERFLAEHLPGCVISCTSLDIVWSAKRAHFDVYGDNLSILHLRSFAFSLIDSGFYAPLPFDLLYKNIDIENLVLRGISFVHMNVLSIATSENPGSYPPLTELGRLTRLELSDVDQATPLFHLCTQFPTQYFPSLVSLYLTRVILDPEVLMGYVRMKIGKSGRISYVTPLRILSLRGIPLREEYSTELMDLVNTVEGFTAEISL